VLDFTAHFGEGSAVPFVFRAQRDQFSQDEIKMIEQYGEAFEALATGRRVPNTAAQVHFVEAANRMVSPRTVYERVWGRYVLGNQGPSPDLRAVREADSSPKVDVSGTSQTQGPPLRRKQARHGGSAQPNKKTGAGCPYCGGHAFRVNAFGARVCVSCRRTHGQALRDKDYDVLHHSRSRDPWGNTHGIPNADTYP
jgi:uncharacterized protein YifE (UPF0438 family)